MGTGKRGRKEAVAYGEKVHEKARGRPRSASQTALIRWLIARQDALAQRVRVQIEDILATHVPADDVHATWGAERQRVRAAILGCYTRADVAGSIVETAQRDGVAGVETALRDMAFALLRELAGSEDSDSAPPRVVPRLSPSRTLAAARGRTAALQAQLSNLRLRIARPRRIGQGVPGTA